MAASRDWEHPANTHSTVLIHSGNHLPKFSLSVILQDFGSVHLIQKQKTSAKQKKIAGKLIGLAFPPNPIVLNKKCHCCPRRWVRSITWTGGFNIWMQRFKGFGNVSNKHQVVHSTIGVVQK